MTEEVRGRGGGIVRGGGVRGGVRGRGVRGGGRGDGAQRDPAESLSEIHLLFLVAGRVSELWRGAGGETTAGGASEPPLPLHQRT